MRAIGRARGVLVLCVALSTRAGGIQTGVRGGVAAPHATYDILVDINSFDAAELRQACVLAGAFVDGLGPDDRVAILAVTNVPSAVHGTTERPASRAALESMIAEALSRQARAAGGDRSFEWTIGLSDAVAIAEGDARALERVQRDVLAKGGMPGEWIVLRAREIAARARADNPLIPATAQLAQAAREPGERQVFLWITNRPGSSAVDLNGPAGLLVGTLRAGGSSLFVVMPPTSTGEGARSYQSLTTTTRGATITLRTIDSTAQALLRATARGAPRRPDPAGLSELTSVRRAVDRPATAAYLALVEQYRTGRADDAVAELAAWPAARVQREIGPVGSSSALESAIALHAEAAIRSGSSTLAEIAARAVDALRSRRPDSPLCRHWALANAARSRETARSIELTTAAADAPVLVALGSSLELPLVAEREKQPGLGRVVAPPADLSRAADLYRASLAVDERFLEARVRLGRVLALQHRTNEAIAELERVARSRDADARVSYLAWLFVGDIHDEAGDLEAALVAYREAVARYPCGMAPRLAVARELQALGRRTEAARIVYEGLSPASRDCAAVDPWQDCLHPLERELDALRQAARK
jgi:tetratricopeptide (TPR) repeat protein